MTKVSGLLNLPTAQKVSKHFVPDLQGWLSSGLSRIMGVASLSALWGGVVYTCPVQGKGSAWSRYQRLGGLIPVAEGPALHPGPRTPRQSLGRDG